MHGVRRAASARTPPAPRTNARRPKLGAVRRPVDWLVDTPAVLKAAQPKLHIAGVDFDTVDIIERKPADAGSLRLARLLLEIHRNEEQYRDQHNQRDIDNPAVRQHL